MATNTGVKGKRWHLKKFHEMLDNINDLYKTQLSSHIANYIESTYNTVSIYYKPVIANIAGRISKQKSSFIGHQLSTFMISSNSLMFPFGNWPNLK